MKRNLLSYFLIILGSYFLISDLLTLKSLPEMNAMLQMFHSTLNFGYVYLVTGILLIIYILSIIYGVIVFKKGDQVSVPMKRNSIILLILIILSAVGKFIFFNYFALQIYSGKL